MPRMRSEGTRGHSGQVGARERVSRRLRWRGSARHGRDPLIEEVGLAVDSPVEEAGFEPSVPPCERVGLSGRNAKEPGDKEGLERVVHVAGTKGSNLLSSARESVSRVTSPLRPID